MSIYLIMAYGVFCTLPLVLAIVIKIRQRKVEQAMLHLRREKKSFPSLKERA
jgi:hypothetical protein